MVLVAVGLLSYAFLMPRPLDTTDKSIFEGNGRNVDYCALPVLDGSGKRANDIPKAYTPGCALEDVPLPILAECTEPLAPGVVDMRGLWKGVSGRVGHLERIEQCEAGRRNCPWNNSRFQTGWNIGKWCARCGSSLQQFHGYT